MRPRRPDAYQVNANNSKAIAGVTEDPAPPNVGAPPTRDAPLINPLPGSRLMREDAGHLRTLFPILDAATVDASGLPGRPLGAGNLGQLLAANSRTMVDASGEGIVFFTSNALVAANTFFRLWRNSIAITDWLPIEKIENDFSALVAGASAIQNWARVPDVEAFIRLPFTRVEIIAYGAVRVNAYILTGNASIG